MTVTLAELEQTIQARLEAMLERLGQTEASGVAQNVPEIPETPRAEAAEGSQRDAGHNTRDECSTQGVLRTQGAADAPSETVTNVPEIPETRPEVPAHPSRPEARQSRRERRAEEPRQQNEAIRARLSAA